MAAVYIVIAALLVLMCIIAYILGAL